jgi:hypothetical protein
MRAALKPSTKGTCNGVPHRRPVLFNVNQDIEFGNITGNPHRKKAAIVIATGNISTS